MKHHTRLIVLPLLAALLLSACAITRVAPPPPVTPAPAFKETGVWRHAAAPSAAVPDEWWRVFNDPMLDDLQRRLLIGNENLKASVAAVSSARAAFAASHSAMLPSLSTGVGFTRGANPNAAAPDTVAHPNNSVSLTATASWEADLWGRLAQASSGAQSTLQASADDLAAARLSAQALLAQTYFALRTADAQGQLLERTAQGYGQALALTQARYDAGVAARTDVLQAQVQLKNTQAQRADITAQRAQLEHAIAVLLGQAPSAFGIERGTALPIVPAAPVMLPATLLERRPDIAAAQHRTAAAYAQIGVADAAFFPDLTLSASAGYRGASLSRLVSAPHLLWSLGASLTEAVLDGGQRQLASAQARAAAEQATSAYRLSVLTALQGVEDNLVLADQLQQEHQWQAEALQAAQRNLEITLEQYRAGTVGYLNVVSAQNSALASESSLLAVHDRQLAAVSQLMKNIAGRWAAAE